jgi:M6 family metalloprotease-like protein
MIPTLLALAVALQEPPRAPEAGPRPALAVAVVPLSFRDRAFGKTDLDALLFGKVAGLYRTWSSGSFRLWGKVFEPVVLDVDRAAFKDADLARVAAALKDALPAFDAAAFVAAGPLGARGTALWPHKETLESEGRKLDYVLLAEEAGEHAPGIAAHELLHVLGLADKYDDPRAAVGRWCLMGTGYSGRDPAPPCAECRLKLGWSAPVEIDPLKPSEPALEPGLAKVLRLPLAADGSETLLLERRGDAVFAWHTGGGATVELLARLGPGGRLTPFSERPFRPRSIGARDAWITELRLDGSVFRLRAGPDAPLTPEEALRKADVGRRLGE